MVWKLKQFSSVQNHNDPWFNRGGEERQTILERQKSLTFENIHAALSCNV